MVAAATAATTIAPEKPRSLNRSCIQCRERKVKCDRLDSCSQCIAKGATDECKRELRKKRAKKKRSFPKRKSRTIAAEPDNIASSTITAAAASIARVSFRTAVPGSENVPMLTWAETRMLPPSRKVNLHPRASHSKKTQSLISDEASSYDSEDYDIQDTLQTDGRLQMLEANQLMHLNTAPQFRCPFALKDSATDVHLLHDVYVKLLHSIHDNIVHILTVQVILTELLTDSSFEQRNRYAFGQITTALMVIFAALRFAPLDCAYTWSRRGSSSTSGSDNGYARVNALSQKDIRQRQRRIYSLVKRIQRFDRPSPLASNKHRTYRIAPSHFNTRQPLNLFDDELLIIPCLALHLRSTRTHVSYSYATIDFAMMTRIPVDQVNAQSDLDTGPDSAQGWGLASMFGQRLSSAQRDSLDQMFQSIIAAFPAHYSLEVRYDVIALVDIKRWLLHQRLFYLFLTLHVPLVSEATRPHGSLMYMANHILHIQDKVTDVNTRLDNSYLITLQTLRGCLALLLDLVFTDAPVNISGLTRLMTRRKIITALEKIPMDVLSSTTTKLSIQLVRLLMSLEEQHHRLQLGSGASSVDMSPGAASDMTPVAQEPTIDVIADAATLRNRWHATCQILDVLLNDGYWRSFRKNRLQLDHLIPEWLQKPQREEHNVKPMQVASSSAEVMQTQIASGASFASRLEHAFDSGTAEAVLGPLNDLGLILPFDPKLWEDLDVSGFDVPDGPSQMPQFDMDLLGHQDFEGIGNSSQSIDFAKMLMDWRVDVPLNS
ncbi:related to ASG1 - activator of stress genes [Ustilago hordei]|uniref:related to ASG1 - activator of stress genes n=1 Tax=Ustilago hordei TaxID=120017 RepID=UPI001A5FDEA0|nr:related to ASG1 - activator of stress genes [Ustilago hordei]SYW77169.1 related to ASG1 - activator of stress genes [Ustilago hordei]